MKNLIELVSEVYGFNAEVHLVEIDGLNQAQMSDDEFVIDRLATHIEVMGINDLSYSDAFDEIELLYNQLSGGR